MYDHGKLTYIAQIAAGAYGEYAQKGASVSGCGDLERMLSEHAQEIELGAWIVDGREVPLGAAIHESISGPMVGGHLHEQQVSRFDVPSDVVGAKFTATICSAFGMGGLLAQQIAADAPGPFDYVSPAVAAARWAAIGARIGTWTGDGVAWIEA
jgi:hypothetical protein